MKTPVAKAVIADNELEPILLTQVKPKDMVTLVHAGGDMATKRVEDFLPHINHWFSSGWYGPFRRPQPQR